MSDCRSITAICVDTLNHELALSACLRMANHGFAEVVLVTDEGIEQHLPATPVPGLRVERIAALRGRSGYSDYVLRDLGQHVHTEHALIFQWDGFVRDMRQWRAEFLDFDYIGALWLPVLGGKLVGNGGFSLRSARLIEKVAAFAPTGTRIPEDALICGMLADALQSNHGIRFAPPEVAMHFSIEYLSMFGYRERAPQFVAKETFGFHGFFNFHLVFDDDELLDIVDKRLGTAKDNILTSRAAGELMVNLAEAGRDHAVWELVSRIAPLFDIEGDDATPEEILRRCFDQTS